MLTVWLVLAVATAGMLLLAAAIHAMLGWAVLIPSGAGLCAGYWFLVRVSDRYERRQAQSAAARLEARVARRTV